jgi:hypothetical protein
MECANQMAFVDVREPSMSFRSLGFHVDFFFFFFFSDNKGNRGFRGATCALGPPELPTGFRVPGQVDESRPESFFSIPSGAFVEGSTVTLTVLKSGGTTLNLNIYMSNGIIPTTRDHQLEFVNTNNGDLVISTTELAPNAPTDAEADLFIVVQAAQSATTKIDFSLEHNAGSLVPGLPDWAFAIIIVVAVLCCSCILAVAAFFIVKWRQNRPKKKKNDSARSGIMMQQQSGQWSSPMTSDYPSSQTMQQQQQQMQMQQMQMQQQQQQQIQQQQMQPSYGERAQSDYPSVMGSQQYAGSYRDDFGSSTSQHALMNQQGQTSSYHEDETMLPMW